MAHPPFFLIVQVGGMNESKLFADCTRQSWGISGKGRPPPFESMMSPVVLLYLPERPSTPAPLHPKHRPTPRALWMEGGLYEGSLFPIPSNRNVCNSDPRPARPARPLIRFPRPEAVDDPPGCASRSPTWKLKGRVAPAGFPTGARADPA